MLFRSISSQLYEIALVHLMEQGVFSEKELKTILEQTKELSNLAFTTNSINDFKRMALIEEEYQKEVEQQNIEKEV